MTDVSASSEESISVALDSSSFLTEKLINRMCFIINSYPFYTDHTHERNSDCEETHGRACIQNDMCI